MTAQPLEAEAAVEPQRIILPRTIKAIREVLTPEERERFTEEIENTPSHELSPLIERWWCHGVMNLAGAWDDIALLRAGKMRTVPIEDVLPELRAA